MLIRACPASASSLQVDLVHFGPISGPWREKLVPMPWDIFWIQTVCLQSWSPSRIDSARTSLRFASASLVFIKEDIIPGMPICAVQYREEVKKVKDRKPASPHEDPTYTNHAVWAASPPIFDELRQKAKARGLYNFFLPEVGKLSVLEYAPICEILGAFGLCNVAMNCTAPDTGNMEVLEKFGTEEQKKRWLVPLLEGKIRSAYAMTEPGVASSDATNISATITRDGDEYVINGHKWYISGACRPECKLFIFLGRSTSNESNEKNEKRHSQHSMILVPRDAEGVHIIRPLAVFGHIHDHAEILFENVRVPVSNMLLGEGRGFEIAQGRLGPGRIHHCMRTIGTAEQALDAIIHRVHQRVAFGKLLADQATIRQNHCRSKNGHHQVTPPMLPSCCTSR